MALIPALSGEAGESVRDQLFYIEFQESQPARIGKKNKPNSNQVDGKKCKSKQKLMK